MKKNDILLLAFVVLFVAVLLYQDLFIKLISIYWFVGKWVGICAMLLFAFVRLIRRKEKTELSSIITIGILIICWALQFYRDIDNYKKNVCAEKFGQEFNARRRTLHIPEIPKDWDFEYQYDRFVDWKGKSVTGHERKSIGIDSNCNLQFEEDVYNLKPMHRKSRNVTISTHWTSGKDSLFFSYYDGDSSRNITRQISDSILDAERIKKDY